MPTGSVILFKEDRGYGFIRPKDSEDAKDNVYVHVSVLQESGIETLNLGQRVSYELHTEGDKISAVDVKLLD